MNAFIVGTGYSLGPVVASLLLSVAPWPWLFGCQVPLGILGGLLGWRYLPKSPPLANRQPYDLVLALLELARNGQQVILATHDYVLLKWFDLLMDKGKGDHVVFHHLYREAGSDDILQESQADFSIVGRSAISNTFAELYDEDVKRALGGD